MRRICFGLFLLLSLTLPALASAQIYDTADLSLRMTSLAWSPDGAQIAASFADATVRVWDYEGDDALSTPRLAFHPIVVDSVEWTQDGHYLITQGSGRKDNTLQGEAAKWNAETGERVETLFTYHLDTLFELNSVAYNTFPVIGFDSTFEHAAYSFNSRLVALSDSMSIIFVGDQANPPQSVHRILWSPDNTRLAIDFGGTDTYQIQTFEVATGKFINTIGGPDYWVFDMFWSYDSDQLVVSSIWANPFSPSMQVRIYTVKPDNDYLAGEDHFWTFESQYATIDGHPRTDLLAVATTAGIQIFDPMQNEPIAEITREPVVRIDWSPDGRHLAGGMMDGTVHIWDVADLVE